MKTTLLLITVTLLAFLHPAAAQNPIEGELFPPDFLLAQREAIGLNEKQLQDIQSIVQDVQQKFETLKGQLEERGRAFQEILHQPKPDIAQVEDKLRAMLTQENEMKLLQVHLMLSLRNTLTAEQVDKARQLRQQQPSPTAGKDPREGLPERLGKKFEQLKTAMQERAFEGAPPEEIVKQVGEIQKLAQSGQPLEAERRIDQLIVQLREGKKKP
ncbi:MAG: periplasmic heavy metal sensor [Chthoniobacter sp.]|uniref:Spy/CpxP family protein refolding chaperone n=1 Tax=Chthoniobacter sp. TaxID=2510640 RepID=UPI0032A407A6